MFVVDCDHAVQRTYWFGEDDEEVGGEDYVGRAGYGGTCMSDAFKLIQEQMAMRQIDVGGVVCMTDGELPMSSFMKKDSGWYLPLLYIFTRESSKWPGGQNDWRGGGNSGEFLGELIYFKNKGKKLGER